MENYQLEAKTHGNTVTISALETKTEIITIGDFHYNQKTPIISDIGNYAYTKKEKTTFVTVIPNIQNGSSERFNSNVSEK